MSICFTRAGLQTSVQDCGRPGLMHYGIPPGGAADPLAMTLANLILGNVTNNPVIEITLTGPRIEFACDISIAITGARFKVTLNGNAVNNFETIQIQRGDTLDFAQLISGARAYIGFSGKMVVPELLGSVSTHLISHFGGHRYGAIKAGDTIDFCNIRTAKTVRLAPQFHLHYTPHPQFRVVSGPDKLLFDNDTVEQFYHTTYTVSAQSNRMGIRLHPPSTSSPPARNERVFEQMVSSGLYPGSIQIPPDTEPIIAFVEGQTIGGYPRIAHVIKADRHRLGQLKAHDKISFHPVGLAQATRILREKYQRLSELQQSLATDSKVSLML
ncbi:biotin-dependent carboxyltransferase family protein [Microbulbifer spongiae]|uniref:Biotin-dependent carboxyltransferase family protein n=1 Tax=Microbulbifer spongiae TaxID=2944933 RepID=A0ABY9E8L2_9GAMM|nr:biotin-dependent carboxyltransferase family protein [Microbulbifer sp. MI-G]WKD49348.1 biotin-dependent carboxyltransferase family protein [Microbulbifer sp. MI-G]